jgi:hypothetical protein
LAVASSLVLTFDEEVVCFATKKRNGTKKGTIRDNHSWALIITHDGVGSDTLLHPNKYKRTGFDR